MKNLAARTFAWLVERLPARFRERMFLACAASLGVESFVVTGKLGEFEGGIRDRMVHGAYLQDRTWAPALQEVLADRLFRKGEGAYIDVGANIGLTTIPLARARHVECHAFEPEARNNAFLRKNVIANRVGDRVRTYDFALSDADAELVFELASDNMGDHRVRAAGPAEVRTGEPNRYGEHLRETTVVQGRRLDGILDVSTLRRPLVMKLDAQGSEVKALRGAPRLLHELDALIVEFWPYGLRRLGDSPEELIELVRGFPFGAVLSGPEAAAGLRPAEEALALMRALGERKDDPGWLDVVFTRTQTW
ncbi:MAG TPA: FkbM family methyltransferase [Elusimicrobiota bacterium]|nr:FkbM family methyltransferase [Elusimicrobiota bacterium]